MHNSGSVMITGATSGIGAALARAYAKEGVTLFLSGRNHARLQDIAQQCRQRGAIVHEQVMDVTDAKACERWIAHAANTGPVGIIIANAGVSGGFERGRESDRHVFDVNLIGVVNTILPIIPIMKAQGHGQIAIISSLASFYPFVDGAAYCASKAAVRFWGDALRIDLAPAGIGVSVVCPGFVTTPMIENDDFPKPLEITADQAAQKIIRGIRRNKGRIIFPWALYIPLKILTALPVGLMGRFMKRPVKR